MTISRCADPRCDRRSGDGFVSAPGHGDTQLLVTFFCRVPVTDIPRVLELTGDSSFTFHEVGASQHHTAERTGIAISFELRIEGTAIRAKERTTSV